MEKSHTRLNYLDNLKLFLAMSVITFHVAVAYGPMGGWYYYERGDNLLVNIPLASLVVYLDAFFMILFFFISGYLTPSEYDRKGPRRYFYSKLKRLGIPLLLFVFTLSPLQEFIKLHFVNRSPQTFFDYYIHEVLTMRDLCPGQMWFVATLLVFSIIYMLLRELFRNWNTSADSAPLTLVRTLRFTFFLGLGACALRQLFPAGREFFHFIIGNYAQYIVFFIGGIFAARRGWIETIPQNAAYFWRLSLLILIPAVFLILIGGGALDNGTDIFTTGVSWQFYTFTFWQIFFCTAMIITLLLIFKRRFNTKNIWSNDSYAAYIIHPLTTIPYALLIMHLEVSPLIKFIFVSICGIVTSFAVSRFIVRRMPLLKDIL